MRKILELNAFDARSKSSLDPATAQLVQRRQQTFGPTSMLFYRRPLHLVRGEGAYLYDADGSRYLDAYNNVPSVGHCHPRIVAAVSQQMARLNTHTRYLYDNVYDYAERLLATYPPEISNIVFTCTGSESVDLALRIAMTLTGGTALIATANAYHGNTALATEVSPSSASALPRGDNIFLVPAPDTYRDPNGVAEAKFLAAIAEAIESIKRKGLRLAAMIADSILSSDGVYPGTAGFLSDAAELVRRAGGLVVADEVQPGFGRTGVNMWGFSRHGFVPDMAVMGKPMGNGFPIGGVAIKPELLEAFGSQNGYFNTFGGSPVAAAAGLAVLDVLESEGLQQNASETGKYLRDELRKVAAIHDSVGDVRGIGLYVGVEIVKGNGSSEPDTSRAEAIVNGMRERNVLVGTAGRGGNVLKIRPPLCFSKADANALVEAFAGALTESQNDRGNKT